MTRSEETAADYPMKAPCVKVTRSDLRHKGATELSIINAVAIYKRLRSRSRWRSRRTEYLYVIQSTNLEGVMVYSKGKLLREHGEDHFYFLVSAKRAL